MIMHIMKTSYYIRWAILVVLLGAIWWANSLFIGRATFVRWDAVYRLDPGTGTKISLTVLVRHALNPVAASSEISWVEFITTDDGIYYAWAYCHDIPAQWFDIESFELLPSDSGIKVQDKYGIYRSTFDPEDKIGRVDCPEGDWITFEKIANR